MSKNNFDLIRLFAAAQVAITHGYGYLKIDNQFLSLLIKFLELFPGVPIFFVISGFLISSSIERNSDIKIYFKNRILRIYPALWVSIACSLFAVYIFYPMNEMPIYNLLKWIVCKVTILQSYHDHFFDAFGTGNPNGALWTISLELQFYVLLPFLYFLLSKTTRVNTVLLLSFGLFVMINIFFVSSESSETFLIKVLRISVFPYLYMFIIGIIIQKNIYFLKNILFNNAAMWSAIYLILVMMASKIGFMGSGTLISPIIGACLAFLIISFAFTKVEFSDSILRNNDISYGIYLYHLIIINIFIEINLTGDAIWLLLMLCFSCILAFLSWIFIEKPALALKKYTLHKRS